MTKTKPQKPPPQKHEAKPVPKREAKYKTGGESGGPKGAEPTRFGDWEKNGRCSDF